MNAGALVKSESRGLLPASAGNDAGIGQHTQKLALLDLPNEILFKVIQTFATDSEELQNIRLFCHHLHDIATPRRFAVINLPRDAENLLRVSEIITTERIAKHIRTLHVYCDSLVPKNKFHTYLRDPSTSTSHNIDPYLPRWATSFLGRLSRILNASAASIRSIKVYGLRTVVYFAASGKVETTFVFATVQAIASVPLPGLEKFTLKLRDIGVTSGLWDVYGKSSRGALIVSNLSGLKKIALKPARPACHHNAGHLVNFLSFVPNFALITSLKLAPGTYDNGGSYQMAVAPIAHNRALTTLYLYDVSVLDNLSRTLSKLGQIRRLRLKDLELRPIQDRWEDVFSVIVDILSLESMHVSGLTYHGGVCCEAGAKYCSEYQGDVRAAKRLRDYFDSFLGTSRKPVSKSLWVICDGSCHE